MPLCSGEGCHHLTSVIIVGLSGLRVVGGIGISRRHRDQLIQVIAVGVSMVAIVRVWLMGLRWWL